MPDNSDPPRKYYQLKPKEFAAVNEIARPATETPAAPAGTNHGPSAVDQGPIDVRDICQQANRPALQRPSRPVTNDVHAILADNHDRANAAGLNDVEDRPTLGSRRKRDYWLLLLASNLFFGFAAVIAGPNPMTLAYGFAGMVLSTLGLTWVMWFVMDDY